MSEQQQIELPGMPVPVKPIELLSMSGEHSGMGLKETDPVKYELIVRLHREGLGQLKISSLLGVGPNTVNAILERERPEEMRGGKENDGAVVLMRRARRGLLEGIVEDVENGERRAKISTKDKAIATGILSEKIELLSGGATARVEVREANMSAVDEFTRFLMAKEVKVEEQRAKGEEQRAGEPESRRIGEGEQRAEGEEQEGKRAGEEAEMGPEERKLLEEHKSDTAKNTADQA